MSICQSCGGIIGRDCFNQQECREIRDAKEREYVRECCGYEFSLIESKYRETIKTLANACRDVLDDMEDHYDGAPDSHTLWMGLHMLALKNALSEVPPHE